MNPALDILTQDWIENDKVRLSQKYVDELFTKALTIRPADSQNPDERKESYRLQKIRSSSSESSLKASEQHEV